MERLGLSLEVSAQPKRGTEEGGETESRISFSCVLSDHSVCHSCIPEPGGATPFRSNRGALLKSTAFEPGGVTLFNIIALPPPGQAVVARQPRPGSSKGGGPGLPPAAVCHLAIELLGCLRSPPKP